MKFTFLQQLNVFRIPAGKKKKRSGSGRFSDVYEEEDSVFVEQLTKNGFIAKNGKHPNELSKYRMKNGKFLSVLG